jgi:hypothetical protein
MMTKRLTKEAYMRMNAAIKRVEGYNAGKRACCIVEVRDLKRALEILDPIVYPMTVSAHD